MSKTNGRRSSDDGGGDEHCGWSGAKGVTFRHMSATALM